MENGEDGGWIGKMVKVVKRDGHIKSGLCVEKDNRSITVRYVRSGSMELINLDTVDRIILESGQNGSVQ